VVADHKKQLRWQAVHRDERVLLKDRIGGRKNESGDQMKEERESYPIVYS
jgi:hypothetical protein